MAVTKKGQGASVISGAPANPAKIAPATEFEASGAVIEPAVVEEVDMKHPAVDDNPRAGTSVEQNQIDFNDPTKTQEEAVVDNLKSSGK